MEKQKDKCRFKTTNELISYLTNSRLEMVEIKLKILKLKKQNKTTKKKNKKLPTKTLYPAQGL